MAKKKLQPISDWYICQNRIVVPLKFNSLFSSVQTHFDFMHKKSNRKTIESKRDIKNSLYSAGKVQGEKFKRTKLVSLCQKSG